MYLFDDFNAIFGFNSYNFDKNIYSNFFPPKEYKDRFQQIFLIKIPVFTKKTGEKFLHNNIFLYYIINCFPKYFLSLLLSPIIFYLTES